MHVRFALALLPAALLLTACQVEIQHELSEKEANEILVLLEHKGIPTKKIKEEGGREVTWMISVPQAHAANAAMLLKENELPRPRTPGLEIFDKGGLIPTATQERAMFLQAMAGELSRSITSINGVLDARVHINIPESDDLSDRTSRPAPSASVLLKYRTHNEAGKQIGSKPVSEDEIKELVSRAVQNLEAKNVAVVMTAAAPPGGFEGGPDLVDMWGVRMTRGSATVFKVIVVGLIGVILLLASFILFAKMRDLRANAQAE